jgi:hypothetical protein
MVSVKTVSAMFIDINVNKRHNFSEPNKTNYPVSIGPTKNMNCSQDGIQIIQHGAKLCSSCMFSVYFLLSGEIKAFP